MNNFISALRSNIKIIITAAAIVIVLAILIGVFIGLSRRPVVMETGIETSLMSRETTMGRDETGLLIPGPVFLRLFQDDAPETFYFDHHPEYIESFELKQVKVSELLEYRRRGVEVHFKPFQIEGEEYDILTFKDELAEP